MFEKIGENWYMDGIKKASDEGWSQRELDQYLHDKLFVNYIDLSMWDNHVDRMKHA